MPGSDLDLRVVVFATTRKSWPTIADMPRFPVRNMKETIMPDDGLKSEGAASHFQFDAYAPREISKRVKLAAVAKTELSVGQLLVLAILAGAFIAFGALTYTLVVADSTFGTGPTKLLGGLAFSVGLILVSERTCRQQHGRQKT